MGRGVEVPSDALVTVYPDWTLTYEDWAANRLDFGDDPEDVTEDIFYNDWESQTWTWESNLEWFIDTAQELWPSLYKTDGWLGYPYRETRIVLANSLVQITVSEYCGMTALSIIPQEDSYGNYINLNMAAHWVRQIEDKFRATFGAYEKLGTFSNGESVFAKVSA